MPTDPQAEAKLISRLGISLPSPVQKLDPGWPGCESLQLWIKRDDLIHPVISGNKWRKLKYALLDGLCAQVGEIVSFGGGHSNHLHALGYCCWKLGIQLTALIRGDYRHQPTPMLQDLKAWGAQVRYLDKQHYRRRTEPDFLQQLQHVHPHALIIPEGGSQPQALPGVGELLNELEQDVTHILLPVGSGGTLAGLIRARCRAQLIGIAVLRGRGYLEQEVMDLVSDPGACDWQICHDFHFGGYAKAPAPLRDFCRHFSLQTGLPVEPVYSGKLFFALKSLCQSGFFPAGSKVLALHTGGLQGNRIGSE